MKNFKYVDFVYTWKWVYKLHLGEKVENIPCLLLTK